MSRSSLSIILIGVCLMFAFFDAAVFAQTENAPSKEPFSDVRVGSTHYLPIKYLFEKNIIQGFADGTFRPKQKVTRAETLSMILKSATNLPSETLTETQEFHLPVDTVLDLTFPFETDIRLRTPSLETPITLERSEVLQLILPNGGILKGGRIFLEQTPTFTDVSRNEWYFPVLRRAVSLGIVKGYDDGTFRPNTTVKLTEALTMILRTHRIEAPELRDETALPIDVPRTQWYAKLIAYSLQRTLLTPSVNNLILPNKELTRGELATFIYRFTQNQSQGVKFGKASWYADGASRIKPSTRKDYLDRFMTAAHREYAFGTVVRVTSMANGKYVDVTINDRGPFVSGRIIDLSKSAFSVLAPPSTGISSVQIEILEAGP